MRSKSTQTMSNTVAAQKRPGPLGSHIFKALRRCSLAMCHRHKAFVTPCTDFKPMTPNSQFSYLATPKGITLIEILISFIIFTVIICSSLMIFKSALLKMRRQSEEKEMYSEAIETLDFIEKNLSIAMVNELEGKYRMNFIGSSNWVKFIAPFSEGDGSDLVKFGIHLDDDKQVKVNYVRIDKKNPDFLFPSGFPGAQMFGKNIEELKFYYFDGKNSGETWSSEKGNENEGKLPDMVKVEILVSSPVKIEGKREKKKFTRLIKMGDL